MAMRGLGARILHRAHREGRKILPGTPPPHGIYHATQNVYEPLADADTSLSAEYYFKLGEAARTRGDEDRAFLYYAHATSLIPRYHPAKQALAAMSDQCLQRAANALGNERMALLVRAVEMNPSNTNARAMLNAAVHRQRNAVDLTTMGFVHYDPDHARQTYTEAFRRALEFVTLGGVPGAVMEFGVLGGWSSRLFCELMRDIYNLNNLYLFDSFEGLPEYDSAVDRESYEIGGRDIWTDKMKFPSDFLAQFGQPHEMHIRDRLATIIRAERIIVRKGFYSETLRDPPKEKVAIAHLDCDLYQSTVEVLDGLYQGGCFQDGTVLLFDDWNCNKASPNFGERRAFAEFLAKQNDFTSTPWFTYGWNCAAYILHAA